MAFQIKMKGNNTVILQRSVIILIKQTNLASGILHSLHFFFQESLLKPHSDDLLLHILGMHIQKYLGSDCVHWMIVDLY